MCPTLLFALHNAKPSFFFHFWCLWWFSVQIPKADDIVQWAALVAAECQCMRNSLQAPMRWSHLDLPQKQGEGALLPPIDAHLLHRVILGSTLPFIPPSYHHRPCRLHGYDPNRIHLVVIWDTIEWIQIWAAVPVVTLPKKGMYMFHEFIEGKPKKKKN